MALNFARLWDQGARRVEDPKELVKIGPRVLYDERNNDWPAMNHLNLKLTGYGLSCSVAPAKLA
jgi:hypothetical protein